jgi:hypothetical protein
VAASTVKVRGLRELQRDLRKMDGDLDKEVKAELRAAAEIVAVDARARFVPVDARSAAGYRPVVRVRGAAVEQKYRRTTGQHPEFGRLQMTRALEPALDAKQGEVVQRLDKMLGRLGDNSGF